MPGKPDTPDEHAWHKYFAVECNNRAWALTTKDRSPDETEEMLRTAHASAWHWGVVGSELNHARATMLLAAAHAEAGDGPAALRYANAMRAYFTARETLDWELAFTHAIHAHAAWVAGDKTAHAVSYTLAEAAVKAVADPEERGIVEMTFRRVPRG